MNSWKPKNNKDIQLDTQWIIIQPWDKVKFLNKTWIISAAKNNLLWIHHDIKHMGIYMKWVIFNSQELCTILKKWDQMIEQQKETIKIPDSLSFNEIDINKEYLVMVQVNSNYPTPWRNILSWESVIKNREKYINPLVLEKNKENEALINRFYQQELYKYLINKKQLTTN